MSMFSLNISSLAGQLTNEDLVNITSRSRYALKIMMDFARVPVGDLVKRQDITRRQGIPVKYLDQIMVLLRRSGIIESVRGRDGGYFLTRPIHKISVWDIFHAVEPGIYPVLCLESELQASCGFEASCVTHDPWQVIFDAVKRPLVELTLADINNNHADEKKMCPIGGIRECVSKQSASGRFDKQKEVIPSGESKKPIYKPGI